MPIPIFHGIEFPDLVYQNLILRKGKQFLESPYCAFLAKNYFTKAVSNLVLVLMIQFGFGIGIEFPGLNC